MSEPLSCGTGFFSFSSPYQMRMIYGGPDRVRRHPRVISFTKKEGGSLSNELLVTHNCWETESVFFKDQLHSSERPHIQKYMGNTNWTGWFKEEEGEEEAQIGCVERKGWTLEMLVR